MKAWRVKLGLFGSVFSLLGGIYDQKQDFAPAQPGPVNGPSVSALYLLKGFRVLWDAAHSQLSIMAEEDPSRPRWSSPPGLSWIMAARDGIDFHDRRGSFVVKERPDNHPFHRQTLSRIYIARDTLYLKGYLKNDRGDSVAYAMVGWETPEKHFQLNITCGHNTVTRLYFLRQAGSGEHIWGLGEQPSHLCHEGRRVPVLVQEQGIGRGDPLPFLLKNILGASVGHDYSSYKPVPFFFSSAGQALYLKNTAYSVFDFRSSQYSAISVADNPMTVCLIPGKTPADFVESYTRYAGRMPHLPEWAHSGAIAGVQGGTEKVLRVCRLLQSAGVNLSGVWLQDWVGRRKTILGQQLWWNWDLDTLRYPRWVSLLDSLRTRNVSVLGYINPYLVNIRGHHVPHRRHLFREARDSGYFILRRSGKPYYNKSAFRAAILNLEDSACRSWIKQVIKTALLERGFRGWMADFGEGFPMAVSDTSRISSRPMHNRYPELWARVNREAVEENGLAGETVFFCRSGYTQSPRYATLFWQGDQMVNWGRYDGLESALTGLLSGGLSGFSLNHSDIGGYTTVKAPLMRRIVRSPELLERWMQLAAFTPVMRTHEGLKPEENHQVYTDSLTARRFAFWSRVHQAWKFYRDSLLREASEKGWPVCRPMAFVFPHDPEAWHCRTQMMVGSALLVVPVLSPDADEITFYLPAGRWINAWNGALLESSGAYYKDRGYFDRPGLFVQEQSTSGSRFMENFVLIWRESRWDKNSEP